MCEWCKGMSDRENVWSSALRVVIMKIPSIVDFNDSYGLLSKRTWRGDLEECVLEQVDPVMRWKGAQCGSIGEAGNGFGVVENPHDLGVIVTDWHGADLLGVKERGSC